MALARDARFLLLASGILLGLTFPLAKWASQGAIPATAWVMVSSLGASLVLLPLLLVTGQFKWPKGVQWRYVCIAGPLTFAGPNLLVYLVVPNVGAGYGGIMFALSPVCTTLLAYLVGMGQMNLVRCIGLLLGLLGAVGISLARGNVSAPTATLWIVLAALIPIALAAGNIYRSVDWPGQAAPELLAFWSHGLAVVAYAFVSLGFEGEVVWHSVMDNQQLVGAQLLLSGLFAPLVFRLQRFGGPVLLSQIGYVAAGTSLVVATVVMGEQYPPLVWGFALMILLGVIIGGMNPAGTQSEPQPELQPEPQAKPG